MLVENLDLEHLRYMITVSARNGAGWGKKRELELECRLQVCQLHAVEPLELWIHLLCHSI